MPYPELPPSYSTCHRRAKSKAAEIYKDPEYVYFTNPATGDSIIWFDKDFKLYISEKVKEADREQLKKLFEPILENVKKEFIKSITSEIKNVLRKDEEVYYGGPPEPLGLVQQGQQILEAQEQFNVPTFVDNDDGWQRAQRQYRRITEEEFRQMLAR